MRRKSKDNTTLEAETIGYMPERFITGYHELVRLGLKKDPSGQVFDNESKAPKHKYYEPGGGLKDEPALRFKAWVDRQLRAIGRDVQAYLNARDSSGPSPIGMSPARRREIARELERKTELKCRGCKKYISWQWNHCAWCGKVVVDGEGKESTRSGSDVVTERGTSESPAAADREQHSSGRTRTNDSREDGAEAGRDAPSETDDDRGPSVEG